MLNKIIKPFVKVSFSVALIIALIELGLHVLYADQTPQYIYDVYDFKPDGNVGWIHYEDFTFNWRGRQLNCVEFDIPVTYNNWGFRDHDWSLAKPPDTIRIAMIGDSFVEAKQVSYEQTASQVLETMLLDHFPGQRFEVMNFGMSNYSVGQYNLVYQHYVRQFDVDYVFVWLSYLQMQRNAESEVDGRGELQTNTRRLKVRPIYVLNADDELELIQPADYDEFLQITNSRQKQVQKIEPPFSFAIERYFRGQLYTRASPIHPEIQVRNSEQEFPQLDVGYAILRDLNRHIEADNAQMIFVDVFDYFERYATPEGSGVLIDRNRQFAIENGIAYINVSSSFRQATDRIQYLCDGHLSPSGNELLARSLFQWIEAQVEVG